MLLYFKPKYVLVFLSVKFVAGPIQLPRIPSPGLAFEAKTLELVKGSNKQAVDTGPSSLAQAEEENKGNNTTLKQKEAANEPVLESTSHISSFIKPGIAANLKFGGSGSYPDLPWVSTTGLGTNGKTISGVTYKYNKNEVKIVCACHGTHMSPEEFVKHASTDGRNQEDNNNNNNTNVASIPVGHHPAASAQN